MALVFAGGLALWGIPWLVWPISSVAPVKSDRFSPPVFRYIRASQRLEGSTWSPVLMPLPTPDGFSKKAAIKELPNKSLVSVLKPNVSGPAFLQMEKGVGERPITPSAAFLRPVEFNPEAPQRALQGNKDDGSSTSNEIKYEVQEPLRNRQFEFSVVQMIPSNGVDMSAIMVTAAVEIDKRGWVQHVMLEQPTGNALVDSGIVRGLRAGRGQPGATGTWGRVRLYYWKNIPVQKE